MEVGMMRGSWHNERKRVTMGEFMDQKSHMKLALSIVTRIWLEIG